ncbi:HEAT repeat domain-containing protein [Alkalinema pantanalense CENA528]|uniref:HEAT repeat domain-containing protein n=1 Tax=Alkalinema pantanalense TaxID=1620705 RepID=UPI003D6ECDA4
MNIDEIQTALQQEDFQYRLKAISALKTYDSEVAVPILVRSVEDREFLVRTFVAMGLGQKNTAESFAALLKMMKVDDTPSVRAEAANSLSLFGRVAVSHLVQAFVQDDHWLVRRSILGAIAELDCPEDFYEVCLQGLAGEDATVYESSIDGLGLLAHTPKQAEALDQLLTLGRSEDVRTRQRVAYALKRFDDSQAKRALIELRQDPDYRVVAAALEELLEVSMPESH